MSLVFIISAPSGSGKSTLVKRVMAEDQMLTFSVSYTTREPRGTERSGESYWFITPEEFRDRADRGEFLEHAEVFGKYYGTHVSALEFASRAGKDLVLDIDVQGARQLRERLPEAISIFVLAPSRAVLEGRLRARGEDAPQVIERRLREAAEEIRNYAQYDYILINQELEDSVKTLAGIVRAERVKRKRIEPQIAPILATFLDSQQ